MFVELKKNRIDLSRTSLNLQHKLHQRMLVTDDWEQLYSAVQKDENSEPIATPCRHLNYSKNVELTKNWIYSEYFGLSSISYNLFTGYQ